MLDILKYQRRRVLIVFTIQFGLIFVALALLFYFDLEPQRYFTERNHFLYLLAGILLVTTLDLYTFFRAFKTVEHKSRINYINIASTLGVDIKESYDFAQIGLIGYDENDFIIWTNELFEQRGINIVGESLSKLFPALTPLRVEEAQTEVIIEIMSRQYQVKLLPEIKIFILKDVTDYQKLQISFKNNAPLMMQVLIDNFQDVSSMMESEDTLNENMMRIKDVLFAFAEKYGILIKRQRNDAYIGFFNEAAYQKLLLDRFPVLDEVRRLAQKSTPLTLSVGISRGTPDMAKLGDLSAAALDVALSRGGDQIVVSTYGQGLEFFGGKSDSKVGSSNVRMRVLAQSLITMLAGANQIYIMAHTQTDLDAIGASLGMHALCLGLKKPVRIIYDEKVVEAKTRIAIKESINRTLAQEIFIAPANVDNITSNDILILVDVHRPTITIAPKLLDRFEKIVVIDHHRRQEEYVSNDIYSLIEPASSSTCEIIAQFFKLLSSELEFEVSPEVATLMLAGILVDTDNYHRGAEARTFESSMILREYGADNEAANRFLADEYEEFIMISKILATATTPFFGILIATGLEEDILTRTLIAKVANQGTTIRGINAIFVIGRTAVNEVSLSCRSNSNFNVQAVAERLGGGGHFTGAAAQFKEETIETVRKRVLEEIKRWIDEQGGEGK